MSGVYRFEQEFTEKNCEKFFDAFGLIPSQLQKKNHCKRYKKFLKNEPTVPKASGKSIPNPSGGVGTRP